MVMESILKKDKEKDGGEGTIFATLSCTKDYVTSTQFPWIKIAAERGRQDYERNLKKYFIMTSFSVAFKIFCHICPLNPSPCCF